MNKYIYILILLFFSQNIYSQSHKWVVAKNGDGINKLLLRNKLSPKKYTKIFLKDNKGKFTKKGGLIINKRYKIPLNYKKFNIHLLGSENSKFKQISYKLNGANIYLVSGHGGPDPGALGRFKNKRISEDEYAYDIVLRLYKELLKNGANAHMIIQDKNDGIRNQIYLKLDRDEICYPSNKKIPLNVNARLKQRTDAVNTLYSKRSKKEYHRLVTIHLDSRGKSNKLDLYFMHHKESKLGKKFANNIKSVIKSKYLKHQPQRGYKGTVKDRGLYLLNNTKPVSVFIELGNINNKRDQQRFVKNNNRQALAEWICMGIIKDYNDAKSEKKH